jgi:hypothetical protein
MVAALAEAGVEVTVVARQGYLSKRLNLAARDVVHLPAVDAECTGAGG